MPSITSEYDGEEEDFSFAVATSTPMPGVVNNSGQTITAETKCIVEADYVWIDTETDEEVKREPAILNEWKRIEVEAGQRLEMQRRNNAKG